MGYIKLSGNKHQFTSCEATSDNSKVSNFVSKIDAENHHSMCQTKTCCTDREKQQLLYQNNQHGYKGYIQYRADKYISQTGVIPNMTPFCNSATNSDLVFCYVHYFVYAFQIVDINWMKLKLSSHWMNSHQLPTQFLRCYWNRGGSCHLCWWLEVTVQAARRSINKRQCQQSMSIFSWPLWNSRQTK